jgi:hypothetical protein
MRVTGSIATAPGTPAPDVLSSIGGDPGPAKSVGFGGGSRVRGGLESLLERVDPAWIGAFFILLALLVYVASNPARQNIYNHFVWQADAFLHGRAAITYPVSTGAVQNGYFQDVLPGPSDLTNPPLPAGQALLPFPPLPAVILLPFVALWGLTTDAALVAAVLGALNVGLCWRLLLRVTERRDAAALATLFYGFGTVAWYAAMLGSTWFLAHVVASTFLILGITLALDAEARTRVGAGGRALARLIDIRQFGAGLLFGTAALARLTTIFGAPFFLFVGGGGSWARRAVSAGLGAAVPVALLLGYNLVSTGHLFNPAYDYLRETEYHPPGGQFNAAWGIEDLRYVPGNAAIMLLWPPQGTQDAESCGNPSPSVLELVADPDCAVLRPDPLGMSLLLTSPAYLLTLPITLIAGLRRRIVAGSALAVVAIAFVNLMHFSQGWVQFGYRFSNDFAPFATLLVALAIVRYRVSWLTVSLVAASVAVNAWGVYWGVRLGW